MARQDIFAELSDDILGTRCSSSSQRGKVKEITIDVNTDTASDGRCRFLYDKETENVHMFCNVPKNWKVSIHKKEQ